MSEQPAVAFFTEVDQTSDPTFFTRFLDAGNALPSIRVSKPLLLDGLRLRGGETVLDVGCGMGADVFDLAHRVGPTGRVVGVDVSEVMVSEARRRAAALQLPVAFEVGDAQQLRFADGTFAACRTERMLMHVPDAERAFAELVRVTRRGGRVAVFDFDWDTLVVDSPFRETTRAIVRSFSDAIRHGWIGRQLPRLFHEAGMTEVNVLPQTILMGFDFAQLLFGGHLTHVQKTGLASPGEVEQWWRQLEAVHQRGRFFTAMTAFIVCGTKS